MLCLDDINKLEDYAYQIRWTLNSVKITDTEKIANIRKIAFDIHNTIDTIEAREKWKGV